MGDIAFDVSLTSSVDIVSVVFSIPFSRVDNVCLDGFVAYEPGIILDLVRWVEKVTSR